jgi:hypothetical protein
MTSRLDAAPWQSPAAPRLPRKASGAGWLWSGRRKLERRRGVLSLVRSREITDGCGAPHAYLVTRHAQAAQATERVGREAPLRGQHRPTAETEIPAKVNAASCARSSSIPRLLASTRWTAIGRGPRRVPWKKTFRSNPLRSVRLRVFRAAPHAGHCGGPFLADR